MIEPTYYGFQPERQGRYIIGCERVHQVVDELDVLHREHWNETEVLYLNREMDVDYERYIHMEDNGQFLLFTVRDAEDDVRMVGNLIYFIGDSVHTKGYLQAKEDSFFLTKSARSGKLAMDVIKFAEKSLASVGIQSVGMSDKSPCGGRSLDKMMRRLGYKPVAVYYVKEVGNDETV